MDRFQELSSTAVRELEAVFARMDEGCVRPLLEEIKQAKRIFLLSAGREGLATRSFTMRLMHLGMEAHWIWDDTTPAIGPGDLLICASGSADTGHELYICGEAKKNGGRLALVTASDGGRIGELCDLRAKVPAAAYKAQGEFVPTTQLMGNLFEQTLFVYFDVLAMMLREETGVTLEDMEKRHRNVE